MRAIIAERKQNGQKSDKMKNRKAVGILTEAQSDDILQ